MVQKVLIKATPFVIHNEYIYIYIYIYIHIYIHLYILLFLNLINFQVKYLNNKSEKAKLAIYKGFNAVE